jgi:hyperosmotically inducible periplasmic protein
MCAREQTLAASGSKLIAPLLFNQGAIMKSKLAAVSTLCLVVGALLAPLAAYPATAGDTDRTNPKAFIKDSVITTKVKAKLAEDKMSTLAHVKVDTDANGMVVLSGTVASKDEADKAVSIAKATEGVVAVTDHLKVKKAK